MAKKRREPPGNFVSEWFGHRVYPSIVTTEESVKDQQGEGCPFLSRAVGETRTCIKSEAAKGVCTISSVSNGTRQDWLVCPYRALSPDLVADAIQRLFNIPPALQPFITPAVTLIKSDVRADIAARLGRQQPAFVYFDKKTGGELSIPSTPRSPEFSFDVTVVEITSHNNEPLIGRFGILEIQTMDFHGSYRNAVRNLREGLRMHPSNFGATVQANQWWLGEGVEGPNIANVFKRTFYQMMFKFQLGQHDRCAGCVLAIPTAVWDSWQKHLGAPTLTKETDGTFSLLAPGRLRPAHFPAWLYVFEPDASSTQTPSPISVSKLIGTDAPSISHWALDIAPQAALTNIDAEAGFLAALSRRLRQFWPELASTVHVDLKRGADAERSVSLTEIEAESDYVGPSDDAASDVTDG
jgi:hypothetical protein